MANEKSVQTKPTADAAGTATHRPTRPAGLPAEVAKTPLSAELLSPRSGDSSKLPVALVQAEPSTTTTDTKMAIATKIFTTMRASPGATRKLIIEKFIAEAKLSKAGASTYYQLIQAKMK